MCVVLSLLTAYILVGYTFEFTDWFVGTDYYVFAYGFGRLYLVLAQDLREFPILHENPAEYVGSVFYLLGPYFFLTAYYLFFRYIVFRKLYSNRKTRWQKINESLKNLER